LRRALVLIAPVGLATEHDWVVLDVDTVKAIYSVPTVGKDGDDDSPRDRM
jgi:hypothetical protein